MGVRAAAVGAIEAKRGEVVVDLARGGERRGVRARVTNEAGRRSRAPHRNEQSVAAPSRDCHSPSKLYFQMRWRTSSCSDSRSVPFS